MSDATPPEAALEGKAQSRFGLRLSLAWLIPLIALIIALSIAYRTYSDRGPLIRILFDSGTGITAGQTLVKYKDFNIGIVESLELTEDLRQVVAEVRLQADSARWIDENASFWLVTAQVGPQGISGLNTVLGGAYIEAEFDAEAGPRQTEFTALKEPPLTPLGSPGLRIILRAPEGGSVAVGAPVLYKQIRVGQVEDVDLTERGDVVVRAFIDAPFHNRITTATHFWNASGFSIELSASGAALNVESLASLVQGGIAFDTVTSGGEAVTDQHEFRLYPTEQQARIVLLNEDPADTVEVMTFFQGSVQGLRVDAPVEYRGIPVGKVSELQAEVIRVDDEPVVRVRVRLDLIPSRFGLPIEGDVREAVLELLEASVERGLRAQLRQSNFFTSTLSVTLVENPDAEPASFNRDGDPYPELPSVATEASSIAESAEGVLARVEQLPIEEIMQSVAALLANANRLITDDAVRSAPENLGLLLADLRELVSESGVKDIPAEVTAILESVRVVVDDVAEQELAASLAASLEDLRSTIQSVDAAAGQLPAILTQVEGLTADVRNLPIQDAVAATADLIASVDELLAGDEVAAIPAEVQASLAEIRLILQEIREGGAAENVSAALASMRSVADELAAARLSESLNQVLADAQATIGNVNTASESLPPLLDSLAALSEDAATLPLDDLVTSATGVLNSVEVFMQNEGMEDVPPQLAASLEEFSLLLSELREGGAAQNVNATLASADRAAVSVADAAAELPALIDRLSQAAARADATLASVGPGSEVNREVLIVLNELRDATRAVNALVTALERRPNSVLFGR